MRDPMLRALLGIARSSAPEMPRTNGRYGQTDVVTCFGQITPVPERVRVENRDVARFEMTAA